MAVEEIKKLEDENQADEEKARDQILYKHYIVKLFVYLIYCIFYIVVTVINKKESINLIRFEYSKLNFEFIMLFIFMLTLGLLIITILYLTIKSFRGYINDLEYRVKNVVYQVIDWVSIIPLCINITIFCISFLFTFATVEGTSMYPTLNADTSKEDLVIVNYNDDIEFSDVIVAYINPTDTFWSTSEYVIKRVIGLPGDSVTWIGGELFINGSKVEETYLSEEARDFIKYAHRNFLGEFSYYDEDGITHYSTIIPEGYIFAMGDNRDGSTDSRDFGLIPVDNVVGVVWKVYPGVFNKK